MTSRIIANTVLSNPRKQAFLPVPSLPVPGYVAHFDAGNLPWPDGAKVPQLRNLAGGTLPPIGQGTPANQPVIGTANGFRHVDSAGASAIIFNQVAITALPQPVTLLVVAKLTTTAAGALLGASPNCSVGVYSGKWFLNAGATVSGADVTTGQWKVLIATINGASSVLSVNGVETAGNAGTNTMQNIRLFSGDIVAYTNATIRKAVIWPSALTQAQRDQLVSHLVGYYGDIA